MKKFILNIFWFSILIGLLSYVKPLYLMYGDKYKKMLHGAEIYHSIFKSKQKSKAKKLLLGDSVGNQLFSNVNYNDTINSLACNAAIEMVGHYILLNNYINAGNKFDTVFMVLTPFTFRKNFEELYAYHYFLKPMNTPENQPLFTETVKNCIKEIPFYFIAREPHILTSNWTTGCEANANKIKTAAFLSPVSVEYLLKIKELCLKNNLKLVLLPTPTSLKRKIEIDKMDKNIITKNNLDEEFKYYFEQIIYLNSDQFSDGLHMYNPAYYAQIYKNKYLK